ncbi:hypothetical protein CLBKND_01578 [Methylorubrum aminovorans]
MNAPSRPATRPYAQVGLAVEGTWGDARPEDVLAVLGSVRDCCLAGVEALDADAPRAITALGIPGYPNPQCPAIALAGQTALVILCVSGSYWSKLAYQFGHELGHVVANNWGETANTRPPSHWLEEALVEAFGLAGMLRMASRWSVGAPYANWTSYASSLEQYARSAIQDHASVASGAAFASDPSRWLADCIATLEPLVGLDRQAVGPLVARLVSEFEAGPEAASDLSALNLWPERSALSLAPYLDAWEASCTATGRPGRLPITLRDLLGVRS